MSGGDIKYRGYSISRYSLVYARYEFCHKDYDGPEDGRCGYADSIKEAKNRIDDMELFRRYRKKT